MNKRKGRLIQLSAVLILVVGIVAVGVLRLPTQQVNTAARPNVVWPTSEARVENGAYYMSQPVGGVTPAMGNAPMSKRMSGISSAESLAGAQQAKPLPGDGAYLADIATPQVQATPEPMPNIPLPPQQTNPFVEVSQDHLSTFALETDIGSYTEARNYIKAGTLPPTGTVRVEEFVNYFRYDYPVPESEAFGIHVDSAPSPFSRNTHIVRVGIQGQRVSDAQRKDAVLTFVVDISGSMAEPNRLPLVKQALRLLVNELRPSDKVGIVVYGSEAKLVLEHTGLAEKDRILAAIDGLDNEGSTNAEAGLKMGYELASKGFNPEGINRVILCSDGVANVGATSPDAIRDAIKQYGNQGVYLTTVGFGMGDFNDHLMEQLADDGDGQYAYVDDLQAAKRIFVENLTGTLQVIAKDTKLQVDFNPAVVSRYRLIGYENRDVADADFRNDAVDAGEIGAGHTVTALYEVELMGDSKDTALTVQMRYLDPKSGKATEIVKPFMRVAFGTSFEAASPRLQLAVAAAGLAEMLRGSEFAKAQAPGQLLQIAERMAPQMSRDSDVQELAELIKAASALK